MYALGKGWLIPAIHLVSFQIRLPLHFLKLSVHISIILQFSAHPDGSDIACEVEVKNCTGVAFQCRYKGPCPSDQCVPDTEGSRQGRAARADTSKRWIGGVVPYAIRTVFSGEWGPVSSGSSIVKVDYTLYAISLLCNMPFLENYLNSIAIQFSIIVHVHTLIIIFFSIYHNV